MPIRLQPSTNAGSISWRRHCHARLEVAVEQRVDRVEAGDVRRRVDARRQAARTGEPAEPDVEHVQHDQPEPEHRQRRADEGDEPGGVVDQPCSGGGPTRCRGRCPPTPPTSSAPSASSAVAGSRSQEVRRHRLLGAERRAEVPGEQVRTYVTYCSMTPPSSPQRSLAAATTASLFICRSPTIDASGSAGMTRATMNATVTMPSSSSGVIARRRRTYRSSRSPADRRRALSRCRAHRARGCSRRCSGRR